MKDFDSTTPENRVGITNSLGIHVDVSTVTNPASDSVFKFAQFYNSGNMKGVLSRLHADSVTKPKIESLSKKRVSYIDQFVKDFRDSGMQVKYNAETNSSNFPLINELIGNIDTFYPYTGFNVPLNAYKKSLFNLEDTTE